METGEVAVCVSVARYCFTVQFVYAEQCLCGSSERITVLRGKECAIKIFPTGGATASVSYSRGVGGVSDHGPPIRPVGGSCDITSTAECS